MIIWGVQVQCYIHTYIKLYLNSNFRVAKHANIFELTQNKNYIENIYIYIKCKERKISFTIHNFKFKYVRQKEST